jgi:soluble lytic murein transglycosylase-like protein
VQDTQQEALDVGVFTWQIWQESRYMPDAVCSAGAIGIAHYKPETAAEMQIDPYDPALALAGAARLDAERVRQYARRAPPG